MDTLGTWMMPPQSSTVAAEVDGLYYFLFYMSLFFMVLIYGATAWFAWKYRRRGKRDVKTSGPDQNHRLEVTWTVIPTILVLIIFVWGFKGYLRMTIVPGDAYEVNVIAQKWSWQFRYPDGTITGELGVPVDRPVKLIMTSQDVLHSFYVPQFRIKMDVIPNRYTLTWFEAVRTGTFDIFCTEYCGKGHSEMLNKVIAMPQKEFEDWLAEQGGAGLPPEEFGAKLYTQRACNTCHSIDGSKNVGPSFKGIFGRTEQLKDGSTIIVDEEYIRESILNPQAKLVQGYDPVMPAFQGLLRDREIEALIAYLKSLE